MIEDKLTRDERIRLEALAQSIHYAMGRPKTSAEVMNNALLFELYVRGDGKVEVTSPGSKDRVFVDGEVRD